MAHEEKPKAPRNILLEPDLELEMSGINERGVKPPPIRLPGKTHLAGVLLTSNPWEQRDLDRKLRELNRLQVQKERAHLWAQRRFFMNRIFDSDLSLRFGRLDVNKELGGVGQKGRAGGVSRNANPFQPGSTLGDNAARTPLGEEQDNPDLDGGSPHPGLYRSKTELSVANRSRGPAPQALRHTKSRNSLGIFANPLPENQRKFKIRSTTAGVNPRSRSMNLNKNNSRSTNWTSKRMNDDHEGDDDVDGVNDDADGPIPMPALIEKSQTAPHILLRRATTGLDVQSEGISEPHSSPISKRKPTRDVSFKRDGAVIVEDNESRRETPTRDELADDICDAERGGGSGLMEDDNTRGNEPGTICDEAVIVNLTRTLPTALMLKANANLNAVINDRKHTMITEAREVSTQDTFADQRWIRLKETLSPLNPPEKAASVLSRLYQPGNTQQ